MKLAILDLYEGTPNQGMRSIKEMAARYIHEFNEVRVFDVRIKHELPDLSYDVFISTGGPGNPLLGNGKWEKLWGEWLQSVWDYNQSGEYPKKHVFFICHSFQMMVNHFGLGAITKRRSKSFGTFPCHKWGMGYEEPFFEGLEEPFYVADFRDYQVVQPDIDKMDEMGARIVCIEKDRPHVKLERAVMGIRLSDEMFGVQFHPEADPEGMLVHFTNPEEKQMILNKYGEEKYIDMIAHMNDEDKICLTHDTVLPKFLEHAIEAFQPVLG